MVTDFARPNSRKIQLGLVALYAALSAAAIFPRFNSFQRMIEFFWRGNVLFYDFIDTYRPMAQAMFKTKLPVNGFYYSPAFAMFLKLFAGGSDRSAIARWIGLLAIGVVLHAVVGFRVIRERFGPVLGYWYLVLTWSSYYFLNNLFWGQLSELAFGLVLLGAWLRRKNHHAAAIVTLSLVCAIKYFFVLFALPLLLRRDWRALAVLAASGFTILFLIPSLSLGIPHVLRFYEIVRSNMAKDIKVFPLDPSVQFPPFVLARIWPAASARLVAGLFWALAGSLGTYVIWRAERLRAIDPVGSTLLTIASIALVIPYFTPTAWEHYFYPMTFVEIIVLGRLLEERPAGPSAWTAWTALGLVIANTSALPMIFFLRDVRPGAWWAWHVPLDQARFGIPLATSFVLLMLLARSAQSGARRPRDLATI